MSTQASAQSDKAENNHSIRELSGFLLQQLDFDSTVTTNLIHVLQGQSAKELLGRQRESAKVLLGIPPWQTGSICQGAT